MYSMSGLLFINVKTSIQTENHICYIIIIPHFFLHLKFKYIYFMFDAQMLTGSVKPFSKTLKNLCRCAF